jgi:hypothetical protein
MFPLSDCEQLKAAILVYGPTARNDATGAPFFRVLCERVGAMLPVHVEVVVQFESSPHDRDGGLEACFPESHAAAVKHNVVTNEQTMGIIKKYLQLKTVMAAKQRAKVHPVPRMSANDSGGRPPSCHANTAASSRNTLTKSPNPT